MQLVICVHLYLSHDIITQTDTCEEVSLVKQAFLKHSKFSVLIQRIRPLCLSSTGNEFHFVGDAMENEPSSNDFVLTRRTWIILLLEMAVGALWEM